MRSIFLQPTTRTAVKNHHKEIVDGVTKLGETIEEPICLLDLLLEPNETKSKEQWLSIQAAWAEELQTPGHMDFSVFYSGEATIKKSLYPFLAQMRKRTLWQTIISPNPEPDQIIDLTRFTVHWAVLQAVKRLWLFKCKTEQWSTNDYMGLPAMTMPVVRATSLLFGKNTKGSVLTAKTLHSKLSQELDKSEIWVNSALCYIGEQIT